MKADCVVKKILLIVFALLLVFIILPFESFALTNERIKKVDVLIGFDRVPGPNEHALVRRAGGEVKFSYHLVPAVAARIPEQAISGLLHHPNVTSVEPDGEVFAVDAELDNSWGVKRIESGIVHGAGNIGTGVKIGIIDSGVNYDHPDLSANYKGGYDFVANDSDPMDVYGHGTHVAGTACALDNGLGVVGVAPECHLYSLRVLDDNGYGSWSAIIAGLQWAVDKELDIVNLSLGNSQNPGGTVEAAFNNAEASGLLIVAAAGNSGNTGGKGNNVIYPAKYNSVIAVAATDSENKRASFSSTGDEVELAAPGVSVLSAWNDSDSYYDPQPICVDIVCYYKYGSGTSMASPHVAGAAALVITAGVTDKNGNGRINDEVRQVLASTAFDLGASGRDAQYGYGLVIVSSAVGSVIPPSPSLSSDLTADKANYISGSDTAAILTTVIKNENGSVVSGLSSSAFVTEVNGMSTISAEFSESGTAGTYTASLDITGLPDGNHVVQVTVTDTRSLVASDSVSFSIGTAPVTATKVIVGSVNYATEGGKDGKAHLLVTVFVKDDLGNPVSGSSLTINVFKDSVLYKTLSGTTGSDGKVIFKVTNAPSGTYSTKIDSLSAGSLTWDGVTPENSYSK